jgi:hypothetical protein
MAVCFAIFRTWLLAILLTPTFDLEDTLDATVFTVLGGGEAVGPENVLQPTPNHIKPLADKKALRSVDARCVMFGLLRFCIMLQRRA